MLAWKGYLGLVWGVGWLSQVAGSIGPTYISQVRELGAHLSPKTLSPQKPGATVVTLEISCSSSKDAGRRSSHVEQLLEVPRSFPRKGKRLFPLSLRARPKSPLFLSEEPHFQVVGGLGLGVRSSCSWKQAPSGRG